MAVVVEVEERKLAKQRALAMLLGGVAALIFALAVLVWVLWGIGATTKATPFDADGVRCYRAASEMSCIKTAEPAR
jgi:hypothetical protein